MSHRIPVVVLLGLLTLGVACTNKKVSNPLANVGSKQPDKVLFDRSMDAMKHNRFDVARITLQTLINTYPDSEYIARAKLAVADSWYAEGGTAALAQAEAEYKDFETFFPNMQEAAEAQLKIANIHYQEMEKPDRDYTHAMRAEDEYRQLILQYPDSKLIPEAKQRLLEVQEVIADREYRVGQFYYLRQSYPAAIARLRSLIDKYPLYSKADEALYLLGQSYEGEIAMVRSRPGTEEAKGRLIQELTKDATEAYAKILTRYPLMDRPENAKERLRALHQPIPRPTKDAVAQNKAEEDSRHETGAARRVMSTFQRHPDVAQAARVGEPTLVDPQMVSATEVVQEATNALTRGNKVGGNGGSNSVAVETVGVGPAPPNQPAPRSDQQLPASTETADPNELKPGTQPDADELKPNAAPDANELKPNGSDSSAQAPPPLQQVNEIQPGTAGASANPQAKGEAASSSSQEADDSAISSSKHKKKKGIKKVIPF
jgi:outer membrane protein assembly factor BamD